MAEENTGPASPKSSNPGPSGEKRKDLNSSGGLLDELRNVLSSLGREKVGPPPLEKKENPSELPLPEKFTDPDFGSPDLESLPSSDADFWSGNVLGWGNGPEDPAAPPAFEPLVDAPEPLEIPEPEPLNTIPSKPSPPFFKEPPPPPPQEPLPSPAVVKVKIEPPLADSDLPDLKPEPRLEISLTPSDTPTPAFAVPIPGTVEKKSQPPPPKPRDDFENAGGGLKPKGLVQVACLYPEGNENEGNLFLSRLKEAGGKARKALNIEVVLLQSWPEGKVDVSAWKKAASISGADMLFILTPKSGHGAVKNSLDAQRKEAGGPRERVVFVEQVSLRALYADVLVELERGAHGHG